MRTFTRKGYGRIFVTKQEDIWKVEAIIHDMDEFEYEYLPKDFIAVFDVQPESIYLAKFCDLDLDELTRRCWMEGIWIWCWNDTSNRGY